MPIPRRFVRLLSCYVRSSPIYVRGAFLCASLATLRATFILLRALFSPLRASSISLRANTQVTFYVDLRPYLLSPCTIFGTSQIRAMRIQAINNPI